MPHDPVLGPIRYLVDVKIRVVLEDSMPSLTPAQGVRVEQLQAQLAVEADAVRNEVENRLSTATAATCPEAPPSKPTKEGPCSQSG